MSIHNQTLSLHNIATLQIQECWWGNRWTTRLIMTSNEGSCLNGGIFELTLFSNERLRREELPKQIEIVEPEEVLK